MRIVGPVTRGEARQIDATLEIAQLTWPVKDDGGEVGTLTVFVKRKSVDGAESFEYGDAEAFNRAIAPPLRDRLILGKRVPDEEFS
jgi:hypothetical protein